MTLTFGSSVQPRPGCLLASAARILNSPEVLDRAERAVTGRAGVLLLHENTSERLAAVIRLSDCQWRREPVQIRRAAVNGRLARQHRGLTADPGDAHLGDAPLSSGRAGAKHLSDRGRK